MSSVRVGGTKLAVDGGTPVRTGSWAPWPAFDEELIQFAASVLRSGKVNYWTGEEGRKFEGEYAASVGCSHAVALANGTVALEAALRALGIKPGDEVVVPSRTFVASASCVVMLGARPVFADVEPVSQTLTAESIAAVLTPKTRAVIAVHLAGWPCDMDPIMKLAQRHGLKVIEDCAQCHGASYKGRAVGSIGHVGAFSFCQDKIITTGGEGGLVTTNDSAVWEQVWSFKDHGKSYDAVYHRKHEPGFRWLHESFGTNWRMTEMQSALGRVLLKRLPAWVEKRRSYAGALSAAFRSLPALRVTEPPADIFHSYYKYYVFVRPEMLRHEWTRDRVMSAVGAEGVPCYSGSCSEIYLEKAFDAPGMRPPERLQVARELGDTSLMLLVHPTIPEIDIEATITAVRKVFEVATL